jgi:23S rRNA-/tRNA-specific pseudouridylate synthase
VRRLEALPAGAGLAQRLDRGASGLLLIGRDKAGLRELGLAMERGEIEREYVAVAAGEAAFDARTIDLPLYATDEPRGDRPKVVVDRERGQASVTHVRLLARGRGCSLLGVTLETGRTHQIRAHLAAIGHPLLGDPRYGDAEANRKARETHGIARVMLHALRLAFPGKGGRVEVRASWEPDFARLLPIPGGSGA